MKTDAENADWNAKAAALCAQGIVCDAMLPLVHLLDARIALMLRLKKGGCDFTSLTIMGDEFAQPGVVFASLAMTRSALLAKPDVFVIANTVADIRRAKAEGKFAVNFHFQGSEPIARELSLVEAYYQLGVRFFLLAYNARNSAASGCLEENDDGLSQYGRRLVAEMNRVGMLVDTSHCGHTTSMEAMELSTKPPIFSHSNVKALMPHRRNISDEQIKLLGAKGGVICVNGVGAFLDPQQTASVDTLCRHIDYISDMIGPQHVGLGMDFVQEHDRPVLYALDQARHGMFGMGFAPPWTFVAPDDYPAIAERLLRSGYTEDHVRGIMGENFLRVAAESWGG